MASSTFNKSGKSQPKAAQTNGNTTTRANGAATSWDDDVAPRANGGPVFDPAPSAFDSESKFATYTTRRKPGESDEMLRIRNLENSVSGYNASHQREVIGFLEGTDKAQAQAEEAQAQAGQAQAQADQALALAGQNQEQANQAFAVANQNQARANQALTLANHNREQVRQTQAQAARTQAQADRTQARTRDIKAQADEIQTLAIQTSSELTDFHGSVGTDLQNLGVQLQAAGTALEDLESRLALAEEERIREVEHRRWVVSQMKAQTLAEAESYELRAKRLRESVLGPDETRLLNGLLQLAGGPSHPESHEDCKAEAKEETNSEAKAPAETATDRDLSPAEAVAVVPESQWLPHAVAQLTPLAVSPSNIETFTWEELHQHLGGAQYSPSLYFTSNKSKDRVLQGKTYWLLEAQYEPFAPTVPGEHGAKLTAFFNDTLTGSGRTPEEEDYSNVPVFICLKEGEGYTYVGQYSQTRYSDRLSHSELFQRVPAHVLQYWASQLADIHRPDWIIEQLIAHFWPAPTYEGPIPSDPALASSQTSVSDQQDPESEPENPVLRGLEKHAQNLKEWKKASQIKACLLNEEALMKMWGGSDMDGEKGLRLWWEYLECVGFDDGFYEKLVARKQGKGKAGVVTKEDRDSDVVSELKLDEAPVSENAKW